MSRLPTSSPSISDPGSIPGSRVAFEPKAYQVAATKHILGNPGAALFLEPGLGKTSVVLLGLRTLLKAKRIKRALVIAPLRVCYSVWPREVTKWDAFKGLKVAVLHGSNKGKALSSDAQICVINPEGLPWLTSGPNAKALAGFDAIVIDESTKFKNRDTLRFALVKAMLPRMSWRWILTGTPAPNNLLDLWPQVFIIDEGARLSRYITHFRREYFNEVFNGYSREYFPRADTPARIEAQIRDVALYMKAVEHLDMPGLVFNTIEIDLPADTLAAYAKIEDSITALIDGVSVSVAQASAAMIKLRQLTGGTVYGAEGAVACSHTAKIDALIDLIGEQNGQPLLVAVSFLHEAEAIGKALAKEFGWTVPYLGNGISPKASDRIVDEWNAGKHPVVLAHPASVAHGLNLQAGGKTVCWFTPTWSLEEYQQLNGRVWRQGQKGTVVVHHLVATGTVDETVHARVANKALAQTTFLDALKARRDAGKSKTTFKPTP